MNKLSDETIHGFARNPFSATPTEVLAMAIELEKRRALALLAEAATKEKSVDFASGILSLLIAAKMNIRLSPPDIGMLEQNLDTMGEACNQFLGLSEAKT